MGTLVGGLTHPIRMEILCLFPYLGIGDDNSLFTISEINRTNEIFDFESYHSLSIRVGVMDNDDATVDGNFTVTILDVENDTVNQAPVNLHAVMILSLVKTMHLVLLSVSLMQRIRKAGFIILSNQCPPNNDNSKFMITVDGELKVEELFLLMKPFSIVVGVRDEYNASMEDTFTVFYVMDDTNDSSYPFYFESTNLASMKMQRLVRKWDPSMPRVVAKREKVWGIL